MIVNRRFQVSTASKELRLAIEGCQVSRGFFGSSWWLLLLTVGVLASGAEPSSAQTFTTSTSSTQVQAPGNSTTDPFQGSIPGQPVPGVLSLTLQDAVGRGLKQNLGLLLSSADTRAARGQR